MKSEADKDQLGLWRKLNRLYGQGGSVAGGTFESTGINGQVSRFKVHAGLEDPSAGSAQPASEPPGFASEAASLNPVCAECEKLCKQPEGKFVETLCPLPDKDRARGYYNQPEVSFRKVPNLEKINLTCSKCRRSCKQSMEKLNLILCPGFEPIDSSSAESG
jgi:hypothetical protein